MTKTAVGSRKCRRKKRLAIEVMIDGEWKRGD
eukprot:CAMPEP_0118916936 /NCGR_PEP_ID=MMETSP1166-20130328/16840_1 /TAXON_ID=1104430 /ORGANISM="Chrysoreinhardia sp, Strain CCMP3193" /LENGTH=31 /DNA_ID= /DNA_START= /DNA_END= /DNA_ORIENTATION=